MKLIDYELDSNYYHIKKHINNLCLEILPNNEKTTTNMFSYTIYIDKSLQKHININQIKLFDYYIAQTLDIKNIIFSNEINTIYVLNSYRLYTSHNMTKKVIIQFDNKKDLAKFKLIF